MTLSDFTIPVPLHCHHCDRRLPKSSSCELNGNRTYLVVQCPECGLLTPFKIEKSA